MVHHSKTINGKEGTISRATNEEANRQEKHPSLEQTAHREEAMETITTEEETTLTSMWTGENLCLDAGATENRSNVSTAGS